MSRDETSNVPFQAEALAIPTSARLDRISEFLRYVPVTFQTLVLPVTFQTLIS